MSPPKSELDLSPHVVAYWQARGFCMHGEVAVHGTSLFVDHVAHTGPCDAPEYVVAVEMKRSATHALRAQIARLATAHVADEIWGACTAYPRPDSLASWRNPAPVPRRIPWMAPGLLAWSPCGALADLCAPTVSLWPNHKRYYRKGVKRLLLVAANKGALAGYPSGKAPGGYHTHWRALREAAVQHAQSAYPQAFVATEILAALPPAILRPYRNPQSLAKALVRDLCAANILVPAGKKGRATAYAVMV